MIGEINQSGKERTMLQMIYEMLYLSGGLMVVGMLVLPVVFLLTINVVYIFTDLIHQFKERRGAF